MGRKVVIFDGNRIRPKGLNGAECVCMDPAEVPSLMALLGTDPDITDLVIQEGAPWSLAHILAAGKLLGSRSGRVYLVGTALPELRKELPMLCRLGTLEELAEALAAKAAQGKEPEKRKAGPRPSLSSPPNKQDPGPERLLRRPVLPLKIPEDLVYYIAVAGSQARIGCTTQAIGLWHYCKALGFQPAIVAGPDRAAAMARLMGGTEISGGWEIEGIPWVSDEAQAYDCYIRDLGVLTPDTGDGFYGSDWSLLVAGTKPWELERTVEAMASIRPRAYASVILSFATEQDRRELEELFENRRVVAAPWLPRPWQPTTGALAPYDKLLRPVLLRYIRERTYQQERSI